MTSYNLFSSPTASGTLAPSGRVVATSVATRELSASDSIWVSVSSYGREIVSCQLIGYATIQELLSAIAEKLSDVAGLLTVRLRNPRCGWTSKHTIRTARQASTLLASV